MAKAKILFIEDEVDALSTMIEYLKPRGFDVAVAHSAERAYGQLMEYNPDLIIIDIKLIGESGIDFIEKIQKQGVKTPVIAMTAYPEKLAQIKRKKLNVNAYYTKPFSYADLLKTIIKIREGGPK